MADNLTGNTVGIFAGLATVDYVFYANEYPEQNHKIKTQNYKRYIGGPAANAAITYSLLGGNALLITCLGQSAEAGLAKKLLAEYGVRLIDCSDEKELLSIAAIIVDDNGGRTIFSGQREYLSTDISEAEEFLSAGREGVAFSLFDLNRQEISLDILKIIDRYSPEIVLDAGNWKPGAEEFIKKASVIISSETFKSPDGRNIFEISDADKALKAITRGEKAILTQNGDIMVEAVEAKDTLAAGDIFHGAFCYAYYDKKLSFEEALSFAAKIAGESVKYIGPREWVKNIRN